MSHVAVYLCANISVDIVAIPDFAAGAMENWGLITFRESALLYDEATSSNSQKQYVTYVIAHELAHQVRLYNLHSLLVSLIAIVTKQTH